MLEIGKYYRRVPRDPVENVKFRLKLLRAAKGGRLLQAGIRELCKRDPLFFISVFVWQTNPNSIGKWSEEFGPFIPWDFQEEAVKTIIEHILDKTDLLIEKSREMGASWLCLIIMVWFCMFYPRKKFLCISHTEKAVDSTDDPDCLFWKIDFIHEHLPKWLTGEIRRKKLGFSYARMQSYLNGSSTSERSGVGGRGVVFLDEFSKQKNDFEILGQTADHGVRIFNGTHYGTGTAFYELSTRPSQHKLVLHWSMHPDKRKGLYKSGTHPHGYELIDQVEFQAKTTVANKTKCVSFPYEWDFVRSGMPGGPFRGLRSPWYDEEVLRRNNSRDVAMHLDIDPKGALSQVFDVIRVRNLISYCQPPFWEGYLDHDEGGRPIKLMPQPGGEIRLWLPLNNGKPLPSKYAFGADCATGRATATPSCLSGLDVTTGTKVLEFISRIIEPKPFATMAVALCWLFADRDGGGARLVWEKPGPGLQFGDKVVELGYGNIYMPASHDYRTFGRGPTMLPGWNSMGAGIKRRLLDHYRDALYEKEFVNYSEFALEECLKFEYTGDTVEYSGSKSKNDPAGEGVNHGDVVIADSLCWMLRMELMGMGKLAVDDERVQVIPFGSLAWRRKMKEEREQLEEAWA